MSLGPACPTCGYIHARDDARAIGKFSAGPAKYVAANAGTPPRATRAEAEADECAWRQQRTREPLPSIAAPRPIAAVEPRPDPEPFPAVAMENGAREKAWLDFMAQINMSLMIWQLDDDVRTGCVNVLAWIRACRDELTRWVDPQPALFEVAP